MQQYQNYVNGNWQDAMSKEYSQVINPATEEVIGEVSKSNQQDVDQAVEAAKAAFESWNRTSIEQRSEYVERILSGIESQ